MASILTNGEGLSGMQIAINYLCKKQTSLDVVEQAIRSVEADSSVKTVGFGGAPNIEGIVECDASIMNGITLQSGSVAALIGYLHPISIARKIMENTPHVLLSGQGASHFANEIGAMPFNLLSKEAKEDYQDWINKTIDPRFHLSLQHRPLLPHVQKTAIPSKAKGTVTFLVQDSHHNLAGGVSTSGWKYKYPGRTGDSAVIGAGLYIDNILGAVGCTHTGEMTIRASTARSVILYIKMGLSLEEACYEAIKDLGRLKKGYLGPVVIHALSSKGEPFVISNHYDKNLCYWFWKEDMKSFKSFTPIFTDT